MVVRRLLALALLLPALALPATHAQATSTIRFVVTTADGPVIQPNCTSILNFCSLREALAAAADGDTIQFDAQATGTILLDPTQGALPVLHAVTIQGPGAAVLAIDGGANAGRGTAVPVFRVGPLINVSISGLTIQNGFNAETSGQDPGGGGIAAPFAFLTISGCVVRGNTAFASGGGIYATVVNLSNSMVSDNTANRSGGGIFIVVLGGQGGADVRDSALRNNIAVDGGGLWNEGTTTIASSTIADNIAQGSGGGLEVVKGTITGTTLTGNRAVGGSGGAIYVDHGDPGAHVDVGASTITGNRAVGGSGGAIYVTGPVDVGASTITGNTADGAGQRGGGIGQDLASGAMVQVGGTIVAGNSATNGASAPDLAASATSNGHNLIGDGTGATLAAAPGAGADQVGTAAAPLDPRLDPLGLRDNGGVTPTIALLPNSPAIDAGGTACPATDQRGLPRVGTCDVGAFEYQPITPTLSGTYTVGPAGQRVRLTGTGFQTDTHVTVGTTTLTTTAANVSADGTSMTLMFPAHAPGSVPITVSNPGSGHVVTGTITYTAPTTLPVPASSGGGNVGGPVTLPGSRAAGSPAAGSPNPLPNGR